MPGVTGSWTDVCDVLGPQTLKISRAPEQASGIADDLVTSADKLRLSQIEHSATLALRDTFGWSTPRPHTKSSRRAMYQRWRQNAKRVLKALLIIPVLLIEWLIILVFFSGCVWFEIWVIFDWGGCREFNKDVDAKMWKCMGADYLRGWPGVAMGAMPSICEGAFFELLLLVSKLTAHSLISVYRFQTGEQKAFAVVTVIFLLEVVGKVGFISVLGLGFVPTWTNRVDGSCTENWDYIIMGEWSLGCLKATIPYSVRLTILESAMKGPMLVSGFVGILVKTLLPIVLDQWRRCSFGTEATGDGGGCCCHRWRRHRLVRIFLAPPDFVLRVCMLIFQVDGGAVGGLRFSLFWPPRLLITANQNSGSISTPNSMSHSPSMQEAAVAAACRATTARAAAERSRLWSVLLEGQRKEHEPFDEYIMLMLHFLWAACFAIVWPLGTVPTSNVLNLSSCATPSLLGAMAATWAMLVTVRFVAIFILNQLLHRTRCGGLCPTHSGCADEAARGADAGTAAASAAAPSAIDDESSSTLRRSQLTVVLARSSSPKSFDSLGMRFT